MARFRSISIVAALALAALAPAASATDPGAWERTGARAIPLTYNQGITADPNRNLYFTGQVGAYGTNPGLGETARGDAIIPPEVTAFYGYDRLGDPEWAANVDGGRLLMPLSCSLPPPSRFPNDVIARGHFHDESRLLGYDNVCAVTGSLEFAERLLGLQSTDAEAAADFIEDELLPDSSSGAFAKGSFMDECQRSSGSTNPQDYCDPRRFLRPGTGAIAVVERTPSISESGFGPDALIWNHHVQLDPRVVQSAPWLALDGSLIWTEGDTTPRREPEEITDANGNVTGYKFAPNPRDLVAFRTADLSVETNQIKPLRVLGNLLIEDQREELLGRVNGSEYLNKTIAPELVIRNAIPDGESIRGATFYGSGADRRLYISTQGNDATRKNENVIRVYSIDATKCSQGAAAVQGKAWSEKTTTDLCARTLEIELRANGEATGLAAFDSFGGQLHLQVMPYNERGAPTLSFPDFYNGRLLSFKPIPKPITGNNQQNQQQNEQQNQLSQNPPGAVPASTRLGAISAAISRVTATVSRDGRISFFLACPSRVQSCQVSVVIQVTDGGSATVSNHTKTRARQRRVTLGKASVRLRGGQRKRVRMRLTRAGRRLLRTRPNLRAQAIVRTKAAGRPKATRRINFRVRSTRAFRSS